MEQIRVLAVHPNVELYGADRSFARSVQAFRRSGWDVDVVLPREGPLVDAFDQCVDFLPFPVLRKRYLSVRGMATLTVAALLAMPRLWARARRADVVYVNTVTIPWWLLAARLGQVPVVCHVREAETLTPVQRFLLRLPLVASSVIVANSRATRGWVIAGLPLAGRTVVVYNAIEPGPPPCEPPSDGPFRLVVIGRLSPRKGQDVAIDAVARLADAGHDVTLDLVGSTFDGYEWFEERLRDQSDRLGVGARVVFSGFTHEVRSHIDRAHAVLVPSRIEPFGNAAVEGRAAGRPVVAAAVGGLPEIVDASLLVRPGDSAALANAVAGLIHDRGRGRDAMAQSSQVAARFTVARYDEELCAAIRRALAPRTPVLALRATPWLRRSRAFVARSGVERNAKHAATRIGSATAVRHDAGELHARS